MKKIMVGQGSCGIAAGSLKVYSEIQKQIRPGEDIVLGTVGCIGMCFLEPIVDIYDGNTLIKRLTRVMAQDAAAVVDSVRTGAEFPVNLLKISDDDRQFLEKQDRIVLRRCGITDPSSIDSYIECGGFKALKKVMTEMTPEDVICEIKRSRLRGRGGAGFLTGLKWEMTRSNPGEKKYLICNADEGDPGAFMDRAVLEGDPFNIIEGMVIAAYAIGCSEAFIYVRAEYPLAIERVSSALTQAQERGYTGDDILGSGFSCHISLKEGAGAFVCGEETGLIASLEGERGMPRPRPPFPSESGYHGCPTDINNVETLANITWIIENGGYRFAATGTEDSSGTKVFALSGRVKRGGLVEVAMGRTIREVIYDIGGGIKKEHTLKAVLMGGPSGGCIPAELADTVIDFKSLSETGAIMGSGGMVVIDESTCMVSMAKYFLAFTSKESCGKCVMCRIGTKRMYEILDRITLGKGREGDVEELRSLGEGLRDGSMCGLGQTAPNPVMTTIRYFRGEYEEHIKDKHCPALECRPLITYSINDKCIDCTICEKSCPSGAISAREGGGFDIDAAVCIRCGTCMRKCPKGAVEKR